jgi:low temperature requirement protein LtrA
VPEDVRRVSTLELFFDLVFVFTITQLTAVLVHHPDWEGLLQVVLMLGVIFWMYGGYAWLTNAVAPDSANRRLLLLGGMAGYLVLALCIPRAFDDGGTVFGIAYVAIVTLHAGLFITATPATVSQAIRGLAPYNLLTALLVLAGGIAGGTAQYVLWAVAFASEWITGKLIDSSGFEIAPSHFVERHGLVIIVALGESIVAIGVGAEDLGTTAEEIVAAGIALAIVCMLWWAYFDLYALVAERRFRQAVGVEQLRIARDSYALLHFLMIAGIVLFALGVKKVLEHPEDPLKDMPAVALCGGLALYALGMVAFRLRNTGTVAWARIVAAAACLALIPVAMDAAGLVTLPLLAAAWIALIAYETLRFREFRARVRSEYLAHQAPN